MAKKLSITADEFRALRDRVRRSQKAMEHSKDQYKHDLKNLAGSHAYPAGSPTKRPANLTELGASTWVQVLAGMNPQVQITSEIKAIRPYAHDFEIAGNHQIRRMRLKSTIQDAIQEAIFAPLGVVKHGLTEEGAMNEDDERIAVGETFVDLVVYDDFVLDMDAPSLERCEFMGDETYETLDDIKENPNYDKKVTSNLQYNSKPYDPVGTTEKAGYMSRADLTDEDDENPRIRVMHLWRRKRNDIIHYISEEDGSAGAEKPLWVQKYEGPKGGPYKVLRLAKCPGGQILPPPPVTLWRDLDEAGNKVLNKIIEDAVKAKIVNVYEAGAEEDAEEIRTAKNHEWKKVHDLKKIGTHVADYQNQTGQATLLYIRQLWDYLNGNISAIAGLGPQSETLGQDKLISQSASKRMQYLGDFVYDFAADVCEAIGFYIWGDPLIDIALTKKLPGTDIEIPFNFNSASKKGDLLDYNFKIRPYSMRQQTPEQEFQGIMSVLNSVVVPLMPIAMQQGVSLSFEQLMRYIARLLNQDIWDDALNYGQSIEPDRMPIGMGERDTERTYTRRNIPGATMQGNEATMMSALMGQETQPARMAGLARMVG